MGDLSFGILHERRRTILIGSGEYAVGKTNVFNFWWELSWLIAKNIRGFSKTNNRSDKKQIIGSLLIEQNVHWAFKFTVLFQLLRKSVIRKSNIDFENIKNQYVTH